MAKPIGSRCNLACSYCFYLEKEPAYYPAHALPRMNLATLESFIRDYIAAQPGQELTFAWQGGEPTLMGVEFFEQAVRLQKHYAAGRKIENAFQTNGTLLNERWCDFFAREDFLVGVSIDGPRDMHDAYRVDRGGQPTWERVMQGLRLLKENRVRFNTLTVVHRRNCKHPTDVYRFLREQGSTFMQFIPLVERIPGNADAAAKLWHARPPTQHDALIAPDEVENAVAQEVPSPERFGMFLSGIFDRWMQGDVGCVFVQQFDSALACWLGLEASMCTMAKHCGRALAMEHNGDVFTCDHYVYPDYRLGNLHEKSLADMGNGSTAQRFGEAKALLPNACVRCPVRFACNGDCPKHRFVRSAPNEPGISYLCPSYKHFFQHIGPTMERMAALVRAGRPASDAMTRRR